MPELFSLLTYEAWSLKEPSMSIRGLTIILAAVLLAACSTQSQRAGTTVGTGQAAASGQIAGPVITQPQVSTEPIVQPGTQADLVANVGDRVFFAFDKAELRQDARARIQDWVDWLNVYNTVTVTVEGHADERGTRAYNLALGERRANAASEYLVALGIDPSRIRIISFGKERPAVLGSNEAAYAQNRRAVMVVN